MYLRSFLYVNCSASRRSDIDKEEKLTEKEKELAAKEMEVCGNDMAAILIRLHMPAVK